MKLDNQLLRELRPTLVSEWQSRKPINSLAAVVLQNEMKRVRVKAHEGSKKAYVTRKAKRDRRSES
jgi:hypothetical protein